MLLLHSLSNDGNFNMSYNVFMYGWLAPLSRNWSPSVTPHLKANTLNTGFDARMKPEAMFICPTGRQLVKKALCWHVLERGATHFGTVVGVVMPCLPSSTALPLALSKRMSPSPSFYRGQVLTSPSWGGFKISCDAPPLPLNGADFIRDPIIFLYITCVPFPLPSGTVCLYPVSKAIIYDFFQG